MISNSTPRMSVGRSREVRRALVSREEKIKAIRKRKANPKVQFPVP